MEDVNRRSALALGLTVAATPLFASMPAAAKTYGPKEGKEIHPGVRLIEVGTRESVIPACKSVAIVDIVFEPGAVAPEEAMDNDMVCHITAGEFKITKGDTNFTVKEGDVYTCGKGKPDGATNISSVVGVHRVIVLIPA
jgi:quercetin dioxygenase-like cupin family protein